MVSAQVPCKAALTVALLLGIFLSCSSQASEIPSVFDPDSAKFRFFGQLGQGSAERVVRFGPKSSTQMPVLGDWNGDGADTLGLYDPTSGRFTLRNTNVTGAADRIFRFGPRHGSTLPVAGDWNGDGIDTVGVYDSARGEFHLADLNLETTGRQIFRFGPLGGRLFPVAGDWDGDGNDTVGLYDQGASTFALRNSNTAGSADRSIRFGRWDGHNLPVAGDWTGSGHDSVGIYRQTRGEFRLRKRAAQNSERFVYRISAPNRKAFWPVSGQWRQAKQSSEVDIRLNAGGADFLDSRGKVWVGDGYLGVGKSVQSALKSATAGSPLSRSARQAYSGAGSVKYKLNVPNGRYRVTLIFAEFDPKASRPGSRVVDIAIEGKRIFRKVDAVAEVGVNAILKKKHTVDISDRELVVRVDRVAGEPRIAALRVRGLGVGSTGTAAPTPDHASPSDPQPGTAPKPPPSGTGSTDSGQGAITPSGGSGPSSGTSDSTDGSSTPSGSGSGSSTSGGTLSGSDGGSGPSVGGTLSGGVQATAANVNLSADGTADWTHYGRSSAANVNRKAGGGQLIGPMVALGSGPYRYTDNERTKFSWTDGTSVAAASGVAQGVYFRGVGSGFRITVPADTVSRTLTVYVGGHKVKGRFEARLSDGSAAPYAVTLKNLEGDFDRKVTLGYRAASAGQTLTVSYRQESSGGNVTLSAATLKGPAADSATKPAQPEAYRMILRWAPNPQPVLGYRVYFGPNRTTTVLQLRDLRVSLGDIDENAPKTSFKAEQDLGLEKGERGCFRVVAYNVMGDSEYSDPVCGEI